MLKVIGSLIVIGAGTAAGFIYSGVFSDKVAKLRDMQFALRALESEILFTETPLAAAFNNSAQKCKGQVAELFFRISELLEKKRVKGAEEAFLKVIQESKNNYGFDREAFDVVESFMNGLGSTDLEGHKKIFNITIKKLEGFEKQAEEMRAKNEKLYRYLGVSAGLLVVIILA